MANPQNDNFILRGKKTLDARRLRLDGTPWTSVLEVNNAFIDNDRVESQIYFIVDREYWYLGGTENENLVEKKAGTTYEDSGTIEFTETTAEVKDNSLDLVKLKEISQHSFLARTDSGDGPVEEITLDKVEDLLGITTLKANVDTLETDKADKSTTYTKTEVDNLDTAIVNLLRNGVSSEGDTLNKLYNLILGASGQVTKANITERNAYNVPLGGQVFVLDDGDGKWALYKATTAGVGAFYIKLSDPDLLNAVMSDAMIKAAYENNPDTNAFTDAHLLALTTAVSDIITIKATLLLKANLDDLSKSKFKRVNGNYTFLQDDSGKYIIISGNGRTITVPDGLTGEFHITLDIEGTGALITDDTTTMYGDNTGLDNGTGNNYNIPQNGSFYFIRNTVDGRIRTKGDYI